MNHLDWTRQHVLLTGATGGLGRELAKQLTEKGATVTLIGRSEDRLAALAEALEQPYLAVELASSGAAQVVLDYLQQPQQQPVTGLINNAAVTVEGLFGSETDGDIEHLLTVNLITPIRLSKALFPVLRQRGGWIMNVGSVFGAIGYPGQSLYCASKFGLRGFTEALRREQTDPLVTLMYCAPRAIKTDLNQGVIARLNQRLNTATDTPEVVAKQIIQQIDKGQASQTLGWPERLFVRINGAFPEWVEKSMKKPRQLLSQLSKELHS